MEYRYDRLHYMNTGTQELPTWSLINEGVTAFDDDLAPKTETKQYIADENEHDSVVGYKPSYSYSAELDHTDPVSLKLYTIGADQVIGEQVDIVTVDVWTLADGSCKARKGTYNVIPSKAGSGEPGGSLKMEGTLAQDGPLVSGSWTVQTKTFVPEGTVVDALQTVSATVATGASSSGTLTVTVTAAGLTASPKEVSVALAGTESASEVAAKIRAAFVLDSDVYGFFSVNGSGATIELTTRIIASLDNTMAIALTDADGTGVTFES